MTCSGWGNCGSGSRVGKLVLNVYVPVHAFVPANKLVGIVSTYVLLHNWLAVVGAIVEVGKLVLKLFVPVHAFGPANKFVLTAVSAVSTYVLVHNWFAVVAEIVDVGKLVL